MALVMLPCDLPWWSSICKRLTLLQQADDIDTILDIMQKIHNLCNVSLDPDEDKQDATIFDGLKDYLTNDMTEDECTHFKTVTLKNIAKQAQSLKSLRPPRGLSFSLQQQLLSGKQWLTIEDWLECPLQLCPLEIKHESRIERSHESVVQTVFASSRLGGDFLSDGWSQECLEFTMLPELATIMLYVEALEDNEVILIENVRQFNRIMLDSNKKIYLEPLDQPRTVTVCLVDPENYSSYPESQFEEDNILRELNKCLLGFHQHVSCPILHNNTLRSSHHMNSMTSLCSNPSFDQRDAERNNGSAQRRLSPIGESGRNSPRDATRIVIKQPSTSTKISSYDSDRIEQTLEKRRTYLTVHGSRDRDEGSSSVVTGPTASGRRGRFIVLGSSGECLPVSRLSAKRQSFAKSITARVDSSSIYSSCQSSDSGNDSEKFFSARTSFDEFAEVLEDDDHQTDYADDDLIVKRFTFAEKLRDALRFSEANYTASTDDSYAVDISISGSQTDGNEGIRIRRGGSRGFVLTEDSLDNDLCMEPIPANQNWLEEHCKKLQNGPVSSKNSKSIQKDANDNETVEDKETSVFDGLDADESVDDDSSSDLCSELQEVYEQFTKWMVDPGVKENDEKLNTRDEAVLNYANSLLKRTLSESFVGVPLTEGCITSTCIPAEENSLHNYQNKQKYRQIINARSLSVEVAKHKHRLAAAMILQMNKNRLKKKDGMSPVATGNWGCGSKSCGDVHLKLVIQWMAASLAGLPVMVYYTAGHEKLAKLDTVCRVLLDRKWSIGELASATLHHSKEILDIDEKSTDTAVECKSQCLFEKLIGI